MRSPWRERRASDDVGKSEALGRYEPGLDGVRAMAILVVLAYHAEIPGVQGGFLGISQFFTLSGFLITSILLRRHQAGDLDLRSFWGRRYRRLLPAAFLTLAGVLVFGATVATEQQLERLPKGVAAAALQVANWYFIVDHQSYVDLFTAPSPVQHFWSLAIEEQFYLLLPLSLLLLLRRVTSLKVIGGVFAGFAVASTGLMLWLYESGATLDRLYYGTDTRAAELLVGCVLAVILLYRPLRLSQAGQRVASVAGALALVVIFWGWTNLGITDPVMWRGGFLGFALLSGILMVSVVSGKGPVALLFSWAPLRAVGRVSYGLYLFHWPIYLWLTRQRTGLDTWPLFGLRLAVTVPVAVLSYHLLEMPVRNRSWPARPERLVWAAPAIVVALIAGAVVVGQRQGQTELAGLGEGTEDAPFVRSDPNVLDVLAVTDAEGASVVAELEERAENSDDLRVTLAPEFACGAVSPTPGGPTCSQWAEEWPALVASADPDVVLFQVSSWGADEIESLSGASDKSEQTAWAKETLQNGFDLLTARGATIVWDRGNDAATDAVLDPLHPAMNELAQQDLDVRMILRPTPDADVLTDELRRYQRRDPGEVPRVLVVGDSVGRSFSYGIEQWAAEESVALVWPTATEGCAILDEGELQSTALGDRCSQVTSDWPVQIEQFDPDLVIVLSTLLDFQARKLDGWSSYLEPGDPEFDDYLVQEYVEAYDILSAAGAQVLWIENACLGNRAGSLLNDLVAPLTPERIRYVNNTLLPRVAAERPGLHLFDLFEILCPDGRYVDSLESVERPRPDGVHYSPEGSIWLAEQYGADLLREGLGG